MIFHKQNKEKGQVSLEYILVLASVVSLLGIVITTTVLIYEKNINAIDNKKLNATAQKLQEVFDIIELMPYSSQEIIVYPEKEWTIKYKNYSKKEITISNKTKQIDIYSISNINILQNKIDAKSIILITKDKNQIKIDIERVE